MDYKKIQMPREVHIGPNVIDNTGNICKDLNFTDNVLVVTDSNILKIGAKRAIESLENDDFTVELSMVNTATLETIDEVKSNINKTQLIVGIGGGTVIDVAKMAATDACIDFVSVPTAASHDGIVSPLASIKNSKESVSLKAKAPIGVIADTNIIRNAPFRLLASGCADIISNYTAIKDWKLASRLKNEYYSESAAALSLMTAKLIMKSSTSIKEGLEESARLVVKSLFSSGMAITIAGSSRPASGSEHKFSHALDKIAKKPALHGEQCGIGTIMMMNIHGGDWKFIKNALHDMKAPTNAYELGIDPDDIVEALTLAHTIRPERYTILGENGLSRDAAKKLATKTEVI